MSKFERDVITAHHIFWVTKMRHIYVIFISSMKNHTNHMKKIKLITDGMRYVGFGFYIYIYVDVDSVMSIYGELRPEFLGE